MISSFGFKIEVPLNSLWTPTRFTEILTGEIVVVKEVWHGEDGVVIYRRRYVEDVSHRIGMAEFIKAYKRLRD